MCVVSGIPFHSGRIEYIHRRDQILQHMKSIHKITNLESASEYAYKFGTQKTIQVDKMSQLHESESESSIKVAADGSDVMGEVVKGDSNNELDK